MSNVIERISQCCGSRTTIKFEIGLCSTPETVCLACGESCTVRWIGIEHSSRAERFAKVHFDEHTQTPKSVLLCNIWKNRQNAPFDGGSDSKENAPFDADDIFVEQSASRYRKMLNETVSANRKLAKKSMYISHVNKKLSSKFKAILANMPKFKRVIGKEVKATEK